MLAKTATAVMIGVAVTAFGVSIFWLMNLYRRAPDQPPSGWRDLENVDSV